MIVHVNFTIVLPNFKGLRYKKEPSTAFTPKEGTKYNYKQSLHSSLRTNFQGSEMFKNY